MSELGGTGSDARDKTQKALHKALKKAQMDNPGTANAPPHLATAVAVRLEAAMHEQYSLSALDNDASLHEKVIDAALTRIKEILGRDRSVFPGLCANNIPAQALLPSCTDMVKQVKGAEEDRVAAEARAAAAKARAEKEAAARAAAAAAAPAAETTASATTSEAPPTSSTDNATAASGNGDAEQVEKVAKSKTDASDYYFFKTTPKEEQHKYRPQKLEAGAAATAAAAEAQKRADEAKQKGASAWNQAGTWEEKDVSQWCCDTLKDMWHNRVIIDVAEYSAGGTVDDKNVVVKKVKKVSGEGSLTFMRGSLRRLFELKADLTIGGVFHGEEVKGRISLPDFDNQSVADKDYDITVSVDNHPAAAEIKKAAKAMVASTLAEFVVKMGEYKGEE